jgi:hypothetical protein
MSLMHKSRLIFTGLALLAAFGLAGSVGVALAQSGQPVPSKTVDTSVAADVNMSPAERYKDATTGLSGMEMTRTRVRQLLEGARTARDVVKTLCLNDKLNQIDVAIRSGRERRQSLDLAAKRSDADAAKHDHTVFLALRDRVRTLADEANECVGSETGVVGDSSVSVEVDPSIPDDPSDFPDDTIIIEPPTVSSPIL